jgi:hypothetical protein
VINLISAFSGVSKDKLPPYSGSTIGLAPDVFWIKSEVKKKVKNMLSTYIQGIQYFNSINYHYKDFQDPLRGSSIIIL